MSQSTQTTQDERSALAPADVVHHLALVVVWSPGAPSFQGTVALFPEGSEARSIGRGDSRNAELERAVFHEQRPSTFHALPSFQQKWLSRKQLVVVPHEGALCVENTGRASLRVNGQATDGTLVRPGDAVRIGANLLLYCSLRPTHLPVLRSYPPSGVGAFGAPDAYGLIGETPCMWRLRDQAALVASAPGHVLILGESGTGKEHVARMIHELSARRSRKLISRNAATFPATLIDAELFGNEKNFPNPGMIARAGLVGEANGSSIFLDEIAELPEELQAHLLRVLDTHGEYQRLGAAGRQRSDFRLICATNRGPDSLKHDLLGRLTLRLETPPLSERREDIPFLIQHLVQRAGRSTLEVGSRYFDDWDGERGTPRISIELVERLLLHRYAQNVRELDALLWLAILNSPGGELALVEELKERLAHAVPRDAITEDDVRRALARHEGNQSKAWRDLGLSSRFALIRLMKRLGIEARGRSESG